MDGQLLSATFVELTDTMVADFDIIDFLHVLTQRSVELLDVSAAGLLLADPRGELRVVSTCRKSMMSKSATMVSVSSTKVSDRRCPSIRSLSTNQQGPQRGPAAACRSRQRAPHVLSPRGRSGSGTSRRRRATMSRATSAS